MRRVHVVLTVLVLFFGSGAAVAQADLRPLSPADAARVQALLKNFDPNSYSIHYHVAGTAQSGNAVGLESLHQMNTTHVAGNAAASTNTNINIFKSASTNTNINIFRSAGVEGLLNGNSLNPNQRVAAEELNSIFASHPGSTPLSPEDASRVQTLLKNFDPNSYSIVYSVTGPVNGGSAVGLESLHQTNTVRPAGGVAASTNSNINIFKQASTNTNINIFRSASIADTNPCCSMIPGGSVAQRQAAQELNAILVKYSD